MKKLFVAFIILFFIGPLFINSQTKNTCGSLTPPQQWGDSFNKLVKEFKEKNQTSKTSFASITIPVIVHVLHTGQPIGAFPNLAQGQINSEITILNQDFSGNGLNILNLPLVFDTLKANTGISFCLAQLDTNGNILPEPGIDRVNVTTINSATYSGPINPISYLTDNNLTNYLEYFIKPNTIWNTNKYFNIWISDKAPGVGMLAYSTFPAITGTIMPGLPTGIIGNSSNDGIWSYARIFGSKDVFPSGVYEINYDKGNVVTHEVGHWLGLRHIWGDGNCASDYCNDTPPANGPNLGYPIHPHNLGICSGNIDGEMFYNYMDYSIDSCLTLFTKDQNTRMQTALQYGIYRNQLAQSSTTLCFPVPFAPVTNFTISATVCSNSNIPITNLTTDNPLAPLPITYSWSVIPSSGVNFIPNNVAPSPSINFANPGTYFISVVATNSVGSNNYMQITNVNFCTTTFLNQNIANNYNISLFPNPCSEFINLEIEYLSDVYFFQLYTINGSLLATHNITTSNKKINISDLESGLYIYKISTTNGKYINYGKIVRQ